MSSTPKNTKTISFRVSPEELRYLNANAEAAQMSRSNYIRSRVWAPEPSADARELARMTDVLRQLELAQNANTRYLELLLSQAQELEGDQKAEYLCSIASHGAEQIEKLTALLFKAERQATRLLRRLQDKIE